MQISTGIRVLLVVLLAWPALAEAQTSFTPPINLSNTPGRYSARVHWEFDSQGKIHAAYADWFDNSWRLHYTNNQYGWCTPLTNLTINGQRDFAGPVVRITPDDTVHVFYSANQPGTSRGVYVRSKPVYGGTWGPPVRLDPNDGRGSYPEGSGRSRRCSATRTTPTSFHRSRPIRTTVR